MTTTTNHFERKAMWAVLGAMFLIITGSFGFGIRLMYGEIVKLREDQVRMKVGESEVKADLRVIKAGLAELKTSVGQINRKVDALK